jgi:hypothetical protein
MVMGLSKNLTILLNAFLAILTTLIATLFITNSLLFEGIGVCIIGILGIVWFNIWKSRRNIPMSNLSPWIFFNSLKERWGKDARELHQMILETELVGKRYVDYTDYASSQAIPEIFSVKDIDTEFDIIDDRLCFKREDIEEFEKNRDKNT